MCNGAPDITSDAPGCEHLVVSNNGFLCDVGSQKALAESIKSMLEETVEHVAAMGLAARNLVVERYSDEIW